MKIKKPRLGFVLLLCYALTLGASPAPQTVSVVYAGSLVTPMEGPIAQALSTRGITFEGEGKGSRELENLITAGLRTPDVFISVDPSIIDDLAKKGFVAWSTTFGSASLGLGYSTKSRYVQAFQTVANGNGSLLQALELPGVRIARTDPRLDPKGQYTIQAMHLLADPQTVQRILGDDENPSQIFPEETLLVRLETGDADLGFLYSTEARARNIPFIPLPGAASLSDKIRYSIAIMKNAPHPQTARAFVDFILHGQGRTILQNAGITYVNS